MINKVCQPLLTTMTKRTKYNISNNLLRRTYNKIVFDSEVEMRFYRDVLIPQVDSGIVKNYQLQKPYILQPKFTHDGKSIQPITYVADFYIEYSNGEIDVIDIKGCPDSVAKLKRKMFWFCYPDIRYRWICYSAIDGGFCDYDFVAKMRRNRKKKKALEQKEIK